MAPIYETDAAEKRWQEATWSDVELWEKIEIRERFKRRLWIIFTAVLFVILSAVPSWMDLWPKWSAITGTRRLGQLLNVMKKEALSNGASYRITLSTGEGLQFRIEKSESCTSAAWTLVRKGNLTSVRTSVLSTEAGNQMNIPGLVQQFCFDPLAGSELAAAGRSLVAIGVIPTQDIGPGQTLGAADAISGKAGNLLTPIHPLRQDRVALLLISGPGAEVSFDSVDLD